MAISASVQAVLNKGSTHALTCEWCAGEAKQCCAEHQSQYEFTTSACSISRSARLEQKNCNLSKVEVNEVLGLMRHVGAEVSTNHTVPSRVVLLVKLLLDESGDIFLNVVLFECLCGAIDGILLHILGHVRILDNCLPIRHFCMM